MDASVNSKERTISYPQHWIDTFSKFSVALIADVQDGHNVFDPEIRSLFAGGSLCGPALTVRCRFGDNLMLHKAISMAGRGDVIFVEVEVPTENNDVRHTAMIGGLMVLAAKQRQVSGIVIDGYIRDSGVIRDINLPVFSRGVNVTQPTKERVGSINYPIRVGGIEVQSGELILGDSDGLIRVSTKDFQSVMEQALKKQRKEAEWKEAIVAGKSTVELLDLD